MLYIKILGMLLVVTASYGIGKTIGVYQNRRVEDIYEASDICPDGKWASGIQCIGDHRDHSGRIGESRGKDRRLACRAGFAVSDGRICFFF